jgi:hypothetical protein
MSLDPRKVSLDLVGFCHSTLVGFCHSTLVGFCHSHRAQMFELRRIELRWRNSERVELRC